MKTKSLKLEPDNTFTLQDIADKCQIRKIRTARHYLHEHLPRHHRQGKGKGSRYGDDTLNCFLFLMKLKQQTPLTLEQISSVIEKIDQEQIDRFVNGEESLEIRLTVNERKGRARLRTGTSAESGRTVILIKGNTAQVINLDGKEGRSFQKRARKHNPVQQNEWSTFHAGDRVELNYKGDLRKEQLEELKVVSRILESIVED